MPNGKYSFLSAFQGDYLFFCRKLFIFPMYHTIYFYVLNIHLHQHCFFSSLNWYALRYAMMFIDFRMRVSDDKFHSFCDAVFVLLRIHSGVCRGRALLVVYENSVGSQTKIREVIVRIEEHHVSNRFRASILLKSILSNFSAISVFSVMQLFLVI